MTNEGTLVSSEAETVALAVTAPACASSVMVYVPAVMLADVWKVIDAPLLGMARGKLADVVIPAGKATEVMFGVVAALVVAWTVTVKLLLG
jgi:hypothetical protein